MDNSLAPRIRIHTNSYLIVKVLNLLPNMLTIHFHGLHQQHALSSDGVGQVTQYAIPTNKSYTYCTFIQDQVGTYLYHAHNGLDNIFIQRALIIEDPGVVWFQNIPGAWIPDEERIIILEDLYHITLEAFMDNLLGSGGPRVVPDSLLINGKSHGIWPKQTGGGKGYSVINVRKGVTYRFRIINLSVESLLRFSIKNHKMTIIEIDGIYTGLVHVDYLILHTAQRYSVLITMDQDIDNYEMESIMIPGPGPSNGLAILHYETAPNPSSLTTQVRNG
jgi:iron transport multicopper oxidase